MNAWDKSVPGVMLSSFVRVLYCPRVPADFVRLQDRHRAKDYGRGKKSPGGGGGTKGASNGEDSTKMLEEKSMKIFFSSKGFGSAWQVGSTVQTQQKPISVFYPAQQEVHNQQSPSRNAHFLRTITRK